MFVVLLLTVLQRTWCVSSGPVVFTKSGYVMGKTDIVFNKPIDTFLGVPFAEPPLRELRFRKPQPVKPWDGIYNAKEKPFPCLQHDTFVTRSVTIDASNSTEDCLYLNLWTPALHCNNIESCSTKSVMVFLYGGGFDTGGNSYFFYDGAHLAALGDVIVVVPNYRLGIFGFMNVGHSEAPGNMGLYDQLLALQWIKENIVYFGGNQNSITLMGQSAGAMSIGFHMASPLSRGLFHRAILESGSPYLLQPSNIKADINTVEQLAFEVGCASENSTLFSHRHEVMECMTWVNASMIMAANKNLSDGHSASFFPSYGDEFLPEDPRVMIERGEFANIDLIIGTTRNEGSPFVNFFLTKFLKQDDPGLISKEEVKFYLTMLLRYVLGIGSKEIIHHYLQNVNDADGTKALTRAADAIGDFLFKCPVNYFAERVAARNNSVYMYNFDHRPSYSWWDDWLGVAHFDEHFFVFGTLFQMAGYSTVEELDFSSKLIRAWTTFARKGRLPKIRGRKWPKFSKTTPLFVNLSLGNFTVGLNTGGENCKVWDDIITVTPGESNDYADIVN